MRSTPDAYRGEPPLASRMAIALLALVGLLISAYLALYKLGYIGVIQCGVGGCDVVQGSRYAYFLGLPVALWGVGAYAAMLGLAMAGLQPRWFRARWVALSLFATASVGVLFSAYLTYLEAAVIRAWCRWCVVSAIVVTLIFLLSIPGLRNAR
ncbi:MAG: vitamin K epoxide reductase family protein [Gemmatimonadota bacterium]|nr:vitamin K epoxide reductase family protein [Gemmatimonadota bacterium]